ncbi:hypothetical protein IMCC3317_21000 [Kordia antarctica]|uniref:Uncharacterized protein n=1 Tax=Kordia antarctica TaxID=1218801 RepID=A0A7L4ZJL4_9FLAO|nr:hypothetical protein [Kordia antarctica]QHI36730.1 hypothetical protein IMCC3317_21000 [Kordia antarctica]
MKDTNTYLLTGSIILGCMLMIAVIVLYFSGKPLKFRKKSKNNTVDDEIEEELRKNK